MIRRIRGAQHPDTGVRDEQPEAFQAPSADDARQEIEDFEAGVRRALRETGADGGNGFVVEDGVAPWTDLDADDPAGAEQTRALVEEFEDGVRRALARLDQVTGRAGEPAGIFDRRAGAAPHQSANGAASPAGPATVPPLRANGAEPSADGAGPADEPPALPDQQADGAGPADEPPALPHQQADGTEPPAGPPRRLDAGAGRWATDDHAGTTHPDPRPLERRRPADPMQFRAPLPPFPPAQAPFPPAMQAPFRAPAPEVGTADAGAAEVSGAEAGSAEARTADAGTSDAGVPEGTAAVDGAGADPPARARDAATASGEPAAAPAAEFAAVASAAQVRPTQTPRAEGGPGEMSAADAASARAEDAGGRDAEARSAQAGTGSGPASQATAAPEAAVARGSEGSGEESAEAVVGGSSRADNGASGAGTGEPVTERDDEQSGGTGPNVRVADDPDAGKMDPSERGLVRRVPGAQMPAGALGSRPGMPSPALPDTAEQDAAAARSLVEEFEAGVQRALRDAPGTAETDEDGVR
jgi:hypothetical protein